MAIQMIVHADDYNYTDYISALDDLVIDNALKQFESLHVKGVIKNESFDDPVWVMTNQVTTCRLNFDYNVDYTLVCRRKVGISLSKFLLTLRVFVISNIGVELRSLQTIVRGCKQLLPYIAGEIGFDELKKYSPFLTDFIELIPCTTLCWENLVDEISCIDTRYDKSGQRRLGAYQSYFRFDNTVRKYWIDADSESKALFFPVFLWWQLTAVLPLRPTEFILIPRNCLSEVDGCYYIAIRRTKLKGEKFAAEYTIDKDYELHHYRIPNSLASEIRSYIEITEKYMDSDIDTLCCQKYQYQRLGLVKSTNSHHYTYDNLRNCLAYFYKRIIQGKYQLTVIEKMSDLAGHALQDDEIERINLGDTRHIAMIGLIASGGNPVICKELAGHASINMSSNYYSNLKTFVDALSFEKRNSSIACVAPENTFGPPMHELCDGGHCSSRNVSHGDYTDCMSSLSPTGHLLDCQSCKFYVAPIDKKYRVDIAKALHNSDNAEENMKDSFDNLLYYIELMRKGMGFESEIKSALQSLQAAVNYYAMRQSRSLKEDIIL